MANIRDVAKHAGVAIATVSAALNESASVSEETRKRVWAAVEAVGYTPNAIARSLRLGKSRLIGIAMSDISNPFCSSMVRTMESVAIAAGYSIIVCTTDDDVKRERAVLAQLRAQHVAGIILTPVGRKADYAGLLESRNFPPIVTVDHKVPGLAVDFVGVDNRAAARMLTQYLLRLGHRRIAMITGTPGVWTAEERLAAFLETMEAAGAPVDPSLCVTGNYRGDAAYEVTKPMMMRADRPTAIVGANNVIGARRAAGDPRSRVPLSGRCVARRHRRRALERAGPAAGCHLGAACRGDCAVGDRVPARTNIRHAPAPRHRRATSCSSRIFCREIRARIFARLNLRSRAESQSSIRGRPRVTIPSTEVEIGSEAERGWEAVFTARPPSRPLRRFGGPASRFRGRSTSAYASNDDALRCGVDLPVNPPVLPMLAKRVGELPSDGDWIFEPKWDGFRALVFRDGDEVLLQSRDEKPLEPLFPGADRAACWHSCRSAACSTARSSSREARSSISRRCSFGFIRRRRG